MTTQDDYKRKALSHLHKALRLITYSNHIKQESEVEEDIATAVKLLSVKFAEIAIREGEDTKLQRQIEEELQFLGRTTRLEATDNVPTNDT